MIEVAEEDAQCTVTINGGKGQRDKAIRMVGDLNNNQQSGYLSRDLRQPRPERSSSPDISPYMTLVTNPIGLGYENKLKIASF